MTKKVVKVQRNIEHHTILGVPNNLGRVRPDSVVHLLDRRRSYAEQFVPAFYLSEGTRF